MRVLPALLFAASVPWVLGAACLVAQQAPSAERVLVRASAAHVWATFGTPAGWQQTFALGKVQLELKAGGVVRTHHDPKGDLGSPTAVQLDIVLVEPERLLVLRTPAIEGRSGTLALRLEPLGPDRCWLTAVRNDWRLEAAREGHLLLGNGNPRTLEAVAASFAPAVDPSAPGPASELLARIVNGTWLTGRGAVEGRLSARAYLGGTVEIEEWRGEGQKPQRYARWDVGRDPAIDALVFTGWRRDGVLVRGHVRIVRPGSLEFAGTAPDGRADVQRWTFEGEQRLAADGPPRLVYERKDGIPTHPR